MGERPEATEAADGPITDSRNQTPGTPGPSATLLRDTGRVEAFSDGVFAVAATLLVLNLQPPPVDAAHPLTTMLWDMRGKLVAYLISFGFILIMWINHHNMFRVIRGTDHIFLLLNGLLLLLVTLVPFTTALLTSYPATSHAESTAAAVYSANYFVIALAYNFMWWYATWHGRLLNAELDVAAVHSINRRYLLGPLSYLACVALAFVSVPASLALNVALAIFYAWPYQARRPWRD
ncbi:MAG TPA: TMEM175 family protein [Ktedonobacterales bacterium]